MQMLATRGVAGLVLLILLFIATGGAVSAADSKPPRGRMVDIGGRSLHIVCQGPDSAPGPLVLFESGAFGFSADWGAVQDQLTAKGIRSCAYDRAGLGYSDPGPAPRDGLAVEADLEALLAKAGEKGPYIVVGHSMAGLRLRLFAARHPGQVAGLVLVDAATPEASELGTMRKFLDRFTTASNWAARGAALGLFKPLAPFIGDSIGLPPEAAREKRRGFGRVAHNHWAADEVRNWPQTAQQALEAGPYDPSIPVAVVTAGAETQRTAWKAIQSAPARAARQSYIRHIAGAGHATLLGKRYGHEIVDAILFVRGAGTTKAR